MQILINGKSVTIPSSLQEMTLGQRIDYYNAHGREVDEQLTALLEMEEGMDRSMVEMDFIVDKAYRTVGFFAGIDPEALKADGQLDEVMAIYQTSLASILEEEDAMELVMRHEWNGEAWVIAPPKLSAGSEMTFGEFVDSKAIVQNLVALGASRWESLQNLAAIYLRKEGEAYTDKFLQEGSERLELMRELPMSIALHVGFFLTTSVNIWQNTSQSSSNQKAALESIPPATSSVGAG